MKYYLLSLNLITLFLFCHPLLAQKNYEPGYMITAKNDTLKGLIEYRNWSKNPENIHFKD